MKTINVLGIILKGYSLKEAMRLTDQFLDDGAMNTVVCASARQLIKAADDERMKRWLETLDLAVYADVDIITEAEGLGFGRMREVENQEYLTELLRRLARNRYGIYLLARTPDKLGALEAELAGYQDNLNILGKSVLEYDTITQEQTDNLINIINGLVPKVIIAKLPIEDEMNFEENNRMKMNADMFLGLSEEIGLKKKGKGFRKLFKWVDRTILKRRLMHYINRGKTEK